jgi:hypothetical protein
LDSCRLRLGGLNFDFCSSCVLILILNVLVDAWLIAFFVDPFAIMGHLVPPKPIAPLFGFLVFCLGDGSFPSLFRDRHLKFHAPLNLQQSIARILLSIELQVGSEARLPIKIGLN